MKRMVNNAEKLDKLTENAEVTDSNLEISKSVINIDGTRLNVDEDIVSIDTTQVSINEKNLPYGNFTTHQINVPNELTEDLEFNLPDKDCIVEIKTNNNESITITSSVTIALMGNPKCNYIIKILTEISGITNDNRFKLYIYGMEKHKLIIPDALVAPGIGQGAFGINNNTVFDNESVNHIIITLTSEMPLPTQALIEICKITGKINPIYFGMSARLSE